MVAFYDSEPLANTIVLNSRLSARVMFEVAAYGYASAGAFREAELHEGLLCDSTGKSVFSFLYQEQYVFTWRKHRRGVTKLMAVYPAVTNEKSIRIMVSL